MTSLNLEDPIYLSLQSFLDQILIVCRNGAIITVNTENLRFEVRSNTQEGAVLKAVKLSPNEENLVMVT